ncbi:MAG: TIGR01906 family membrane protein [Bacillota bacterium]
MKRGFSYAISTIAGLLFIVSLLFTTLQICINDQNWFFLEYTKLDTARKMDMTTSDITASLKQLVDYMEGREDSIQIRVDVNGRERKMFNDREIKHMKDVKALYQGWRLVRNVALPASALLFLLSASIMRRDALKVLSKGFLVACSIFTAIIAALGAWVAVDFNSFWIAFHRMFFDNDLWQLDPDTSRMIRMCPEQLFYDIVLRFGGWFVLSILVLVAACVAYLVIRKRRRNTPLVVKDDKHDDV